MLRTRLRRRAGGCCNPTKTCKKEQHLLQGTALGATEEYDTSLSVNAVIQGVQRAEKALLLLFVQGKKIAKGNKQLFHAVFPSCFSQTAKSCSVSLTMPAQKNLWCRLWQ